MANSVQYSGTFYSIDNVCWRVDIYANNATFVTQIGISADEGAVIEWKETGKMDPIKSSSLTIKAISVTDRQYIGKDITHCKVYRNGVLYWTGLIDDAIVEEPYSYVNNYETELTFSDFGILNRAVLSCHGLVSIQEIVDECLSICNLSALPLTVIASMSEALDTLYVRTDSFDEDATLHDVLEDLLSSVGYCIMQRDGHVLLFDMEGLYAMKETAMIVWKSDDARLYTSKNYHAISVTAKRNNEEVIADGTIEPEDLNFPISDDDMWIVYSLGEYILHPAVGFTIFSSISDGAVHPLQVSNNAEFFTIRAGETADDASGFLWCYKAYDPVTNTYGWHGNYNRPGMNACLEMARLRNRAFIPTMSLAAQNKYRLLISLDVLIDVRANPFIEADENDENYNTLQNQANFSYIPVILNLLDADGHYLYHYSNHDLIDNREWSHSGTNCNWQAGAGTWGEMFLSYYSDDDRKSKSGWGGGWQTNKQGIGPTNATLPKIWENRPKGELVTLPPCAGYLELIVGNATLTYDYNAGNPIERNLRPLITWQAYKDLKISVVSRSGKSSDYPDAEIADWWGNGDKYEVDTAFDTAPDAPPSVRSIFYNSSGEAVANITKNNVARTASEHLFYTIKSQYAQRFIELSGTANIITGLAKHTDATSEGYYMLIGDKQNLHDDTSEIRIARLMPPCDVFSFAWSGDVCAVVEEQPYSFAWSGDVCVKVQVAAYTYTWYKYICVTVKKLNTGQARAAMIAITLSGNESAYKIVDSFTDPVNGTSYSALTNAAFAELSSNDYQLRLNGFSNYLYNTIDGLQADCPNLTTDAEVTNTTLCPIS